MQARPRHLFGDLVGDFRVPCAQVLRPPESSEGALARHEKGGHSPRSGWLSIAVCGAREWAAP
eukprot:3728435-Pyramimonas_sp.AAC.1